MNPMPFQEAVEYFRAKTALTADEFATLAAEIGEYAADRAFTAARVLRADVLQDLYDAVAGAIEAGQTIGEFREAVDGIMERRGWAGWERLEEGERVFTMPYRLDNIFRTNVQGAYNAGRFKQMKHVAARRPYWEYDAVNDAGTRPSHLAQDGKIYHHEHPFWDRWYPPNGYRCRCKVNSLSANEMEAEGLAEETKGTDLKPDKGFRHNPAERKWQPDLSRYQPGLAKELGKDLQSDKENRP